MTTPKSPSRKKILLIATNSHVVSLQLGNSFYSINSDDLSVHLSSFYNSSKNKKVTCAPDSWF